MFDGFIFVHKSFSTFFEDGIGWNETAAHGRQSLMLLLSLFPSLTKSEAACPAIVRSPTYDTIPENIMFFVREMTFKTPNLIFN